MILKDSTEKPIIADGAMGTELIRRGFADFNRFALLNLEQPEIIRNIHQEYIKAGAEIIYTHTFMAGHSQLKRQGHAEHFIAINEQAVAHARAEAQDKILVAGNLGPCFVNTDDSSLDSSAVLAQEYYEQAALLVKCGVDMLVVETLKNLVELKAAIKGCHAARRAGMTVVISVFPNVLGGLQDGTAYNTWTNKIKKHSQTLPGFNCFDPSVFTPQILGNIIKDAGVKFVVKPNAGSPIKNQDDWIYPLKPKLFSKMIKMLPEKSLHIIGGCCGTTNLHIAEVLKRFSGTL